VTFTDFCEHSKKLNRIIIVIGGLIITGLLLCVPLFKDFSDAQITALDVARDTWNPTFAFIVGWLFKADKA
jgi:hypothetical protein